MLVTTLVPPTLKGVPPAVIVMLLPPLFWESFVVTASSRPVGAERLGPLPWAGRIRLATVPPVPTELTAPVVPAQLSVVPVESVPPRLTVPPLTDTSRATLPPVPTPKVVLVLTVIAEPLTSEPLTCRVPALSVVAPV